jgi:hypothetical protein
MRSVVYPLACLAIVGCGVTTATIPINDPPHPMHAHDGPLDVFASAPPTRPHVDVALIRVSRNKAGSDDELFAALRERALALGCDALMVTGFLGGLIGTCVAYVDRPPVAIAR